MPAEDSGRSDAPRVAMIYEVPPPKDYLQSALEEAHIPVAAEYRAGDLEGLDIAGADVILVTIDEAIEPYLEAVTNFVATTSLPVVFEESEVSRHLEGWDRNRWLRHLRAKLIGSSDTRPALPTHAANDRPKHAEAGDERELRIWVLGASIGGPESVRRFLEALPSGVPAAFVLAQHMGSEFQQVLADRLGRVTDLEVTCAADGQRLGPGRVIVAPVESVLDFDDDGLVRLYPLEKDLAHAPSIDGILAAAARAFGERAGAIIFSGQARDGVAGCEAIRRSGGQVWTQDAASASISAIADGIREAGHSGFEGSPDQLAGQLLATIRAEDPADERERG